VYGQALSEIADADVRLFHLYVHEPLIRDGVPSLQMAAEMEDLAADLLPLACPLMDYIHRRFLQQDVVGHMEIELAEELDLGRLRVGIAFCDLAGYTRFIEEEGEEEALSFVESFHRGGDLEPCRGRPGREDDRRRGDDRPTGRPRARGPRGGVPAALPGPAAAADRDHLRGDPLPRRRLLRPGGERRLAGGPARGGEVLVTDSVVEAFGRGGGHVEFEGIGQVKLKGFDQPRRLCRAMARE
jgi:adenylate cyclase